MTPSPWPDLPGEVTLRVTESNASLATGDLSAVHVEHRFHGYKAAAWVPVTTEMLQDSGLIHQYLATSLDRYLRPWAYPDRWRLRRIDLFPRSARGVRATRRLAARWGVLR